MFNMKRTRLPDMGMENSSTCGGCPSKAKKSKTSLKDKDKEQTANLESQWKYLPDVVLHDIFNLLNEQDRKNASSVCKNWRRSLFHPKWWPSVTFKIEEENINKAKFYTNTFGKIVSNATIKLNSLSPSCTQEFINLLLILQDNNNLKELMIEPTHCRLELPKTGIASCDENTLDIANFLKPCLLNLEKFSIGCIEDLSTAINDLLKYLSPSKVTHLGLASVKDDPSFYEAKNFDPDCILPFKNLKILSIDYDQLSDKFLYNLQCAKDLERLIVHLHAVQSKHPGTTNAAWRDFYLTHPSCEFRLTVIHAFSDIQDLHDIVLRKQMPLTHLKVFFCENINMNVLESLSTHYRKTLRSVMWVDSQSNNDRSWIFAKSSFDESPDPIILIAWLCKKLDEIVLYGYKYWEENLIAIGRLCGEKLKKLEIAEEDILFYNNRRLHRNPLRNPLRDIPKNMNKPWAPVKLSNLHPVICNPTAGDSDEYLLPIVLADLH